MSDYGINVTRSAGKVQIDGNFKNYSIFDYGTDDTEAAKYWMNLAIYEPTLGYTCTEFPWIVLNVANTDYSTINEYVGTVRSIYWSSIHSAYTSASVVCGYGAFDIPWMALAPPHKPRERYGLEIFNAADESVFASWEPYMEIVGVYDFNLAAGGTNVNNTADVTVKDAINNYFHITNNNYKWYHNWAVHPVDTIYYYTMAMAYRNSTLMRIASGVPCGTVYWASVPSYIEGNCWTTTSQLIEIAPVRALT